MQFFVDNGSKWRALPHEFPQYSTVHSFYRRVSGLWDKILQHLEKVTRRRGGRNQNPTGRYCVCKTKDINATKAGIFLTVKAFRYYPTIRVICADAGYRKTFVANVETVLGLNVDISPKIKSVGFHVIPKSWVVERTFAWSGNSLRLDKDLEKIISSQEAMIKI